MSLSTVKIVIIVFFVSIVNVQAKAQGYCVISPSPWYPLTQCNEGEYSVEFRDLSPTGHQSCPPTKQEYRMVLKGDLAVQAAKIDDKLAKIIASSNGILETRLSAYKANATISLCEDANCAFGPNFVIPPPQGGVTRELRFYIGNIGGSSQVGETIELDCTGSPSSH